jgi:hypothetical protein
MGKVIQPLVEQVGDPGKRNTPLDFGLLPVMVGHSKGQIGALLAESFCERVVSACNTVMTDGNTLLGDEELEMLVILRMNRDFMKFMRDNYSDLSMKELNLPSASNP